MLKKTYIVFLYQQVNWESIFQLDFVLFSIGARLQVIGKNKTIIVVGHTQKVWKAFGFHGFKFSLVGFRVVSDTNWEQSVLRSIEIVKSYEIIG